MKNILIAIIVVIVLAGGGYLLLQNNATKQDDIAAVTPTPTQEVQPTATTPTETAATFCDPSDLSATMTPEGAAGNIYVTLTLKNTSQKSCQVVGNKFPEVGYPVSVTNFKTVEKRQATTPAFTLERNQTIYSLIHYPNGPQCSGPTTEVDAMVSYKISEKDTVSFKPTRGTTLSIPSCNNNAEVTTIDLYPFSSEEVMP